jgi:hypothetical protein
MNIVTGSGKNRDVFTMPHAIIVKQSPKSQQKQALALICSMLSIPLEAKNVTSAK